MKEIFKKAVYYKKCSNEDISPVKYLLEVSNLGNIKRDGKIVTDTRINNNGYVTYKAYLIHRLVACTFLENPENKPCVDHLDCDKNNNTLDNLRWVTNSENMQNPITIKHISEIQKGLQVGKKNGMYGYKWSEEQRKHQSEMMKGRHLTMPDRGPEWRKHISEARKGYKLSPEALAKRREKMRLKKEGKL